MSAKIINKNENSGKNQIKKLIGRLSEHEKEILRFAIDSFVPFTNNLVERDLRMLKSK